MTLHHRHHEIPFAREVADDIYLVIEHALPWVMTSPPIAAYLDSFPPIARHQFCPSARDVGFPESLAFRTRARGWPSYVNFRALASSFFALVRLPRASRSSRPLSAARSFRPRGLQFSQSLVDGAHAMARSVGSDPRRPASFRPPALPGISPRQSRQNGFLIMSRLSVLVRAAQPEPYEVRTGFGIGGSPIQHLGGGTVFESAQSARDQTMSRARIGRAH